MKGVLRFSISWTLAAGLVCTHPLDAQPVWTPIGSPLTLGLVPDPGDPSALYFQNVQGLLRYDGSSQITTPLGGPYGALSVSPSDPRRLYVHDEAAFWKSSDRGRTWTDMSGLLPWFPDPLIIGSLAVSPIDPDLVFMTFETWRVFHFLFRMYTDQGVYRSTDGGNTWTFVAAHGGPGPLTFAPGSPPTLYVVSCAGVSRTRDNGSTWILSDPLPQESCFTAHALVVDPQVPSTVYIAGSGLLRSVDGGGTWSGMLDASVSGYVTSFAVDPRSSSTLIALTDALGFVRTTDAGSTWEAFNSGLPCSNPSADGPCEIQSYLPLAFTSSAPSVAYLAQDVVFRTGMVPGGTCVLSDTTLCAGFGRFEVSVDWSDGGVSQKAHPVVITVNSAGFWFFTPDNVELVVKVIDGRPVNGHFWAFYGSLSNVEYTITITDTQTGAVRTYTNLQGQLGSAADTTAF